MSVAEAHEKCGEKEEAERVFNECFQQMDGRDNLNASQLSRGMSIKSRLSRALSIKSRNTSVVQYGARKSSRINKDGEKDGKANAM